MFSAIIAMDKNRCIGTHGRLPWRLPDDLKRFKKITMGHPVIMGRKTFISIGKALPGRTNIVLTHDTSFHPDGVVVFHSIEDVLSYLKNNPPRGGEAFVIGGAEIFSAFFPYLKKLYLTIIDHVFDGDVFLPYIDFSLWKMSDEKTIPHTKEFPYPYRYVTYVKG